MNLLSPLALTGLLLGGFVAAVYFLKKRPQPLAVSALFLWPQATSKSRTAWRWYRAPLGLLLLQLLALLMIVMGLAQPVVFTQAQGAGRIALIVDTSASMQTRLDQGSRLDEALRRAGELVRDNPQAEFTLIEARKQGGVVVSLTPDRGHVQSALSGLDGTLLGDVPFNDVAQWVHSQAPWESYGRVVWFTDHFPEDPGWQDFPIEFDLAPSGYGNAAITSFMIRRQPDPSYGYEGFVRVENFSSDPLETSLTLNVREDVNLGASIFVLPQDAASYTFQLGNDIRQATVSLGVEDSVSFDNVRHFAFQSRVSPRIFWTGEPDRFLAQAFQILGVAEQAPWVAEIALDPTDLLVVNGAAVPEGFEGNVLLINAAWPGILEQRDTTAITRVRAHDLTHPVLRGTTPENVVVVRAQPPTIVPEGFETLIYGQSPDEIDPVPLLGVWQVGNFRGAWMGMALGDTNLRITVDFPILVSNLLNWLIPLPLEATVLETGEPLFWEPGEGRSRVNSPGGGIVQVDGNALLDTGTPGIYRLLGKSKAWAVNVPAEESRSWTSGAAVLPVQGVLSTAEEVVGLPLWVWLGLAGLIVLSVEWLSYERGWL